jgi:ribosome-binding factor A
MVSEARAGRIARRIQEELSVLLLTEASDPRLGGAFVTDVNVDRELAFASVYLSAVERSEEILAGMESASGFLRSALAKRIELRTFPRLRFYWDPTPENADRIDRLLASLSDDPNDPDEKDQSE